MILSVSRRTDIPAFYSKWFINRLKKGYVLTRNPMNHAQISSISLSPDVIDCIVFWTKNPTNMFRKLSILDEMGYKYYFQFTLNPYDTRIERNLNKSKIIKSFIKLSEKIGKEKVVWRYDPIILNDTLTIDYHTGMFEILCNQLGKHTDICTISFVDLYSKLNRAINDKLIREITQIEMLEIADAFSKISKKYNIKLRVCSEKIDLSSYGIYPASCIDKEIVERICGYKIDIKKDRNQRENCGCLQSVDIGVYNTCRNGCVYCYANFSDASIEKNCLNHDSNSDILIGTVSLSERVKQRKIK